MFSVSQPKLKEETTFYWINIFANNQFSLPENSTFATDLQTAKVANGGGEVLSIQDDQVKKDSEKWKKITKLV